MRRLVIVTGLSGAGKSQAMKSLEDFGFACLDNAPPVLARSFVALAAAAGRTDAALALDVRTLGPFGDAEAAIDELAAEHLHPEVLFLDAEDETLVRRYSETRRRHPYGGSKGGLVEAIAAERRLLEPIIRAADMVVDTSKMGVHALRDVVRERIDRRRAGRLSLMFESFGFKHGIPGDADFVFDVRSLPNPFWEQSLRDLTGRDVAVVDYLAGHASVGVMIADLAGFLSKRIAEFALANRGYLTIAIGCTGGRHRSVYVAERLAALFRESYPEVLTRHDSLPPD